MSKLSFRARALDPSKPMPIFLAEELPDLPEYSAINRAVPQMPSGMEKEEESEHHLQRAICAGLIIPTPEVFETECEFYDRSYPNTYKMPRQMIHMQPLNLEQDIPDYDMDSGDESWVNSQSKRLDLSYYKFEQMMDRLEKSSGQTVVTLNEAKALLKQDDEVSIAVYDYWLHKRLKTQHPLILTVKTENRGGIAANSPYLAFRRRTEKMQTRKNRKNDEASYEKMLKLRRDLSRAVTLLEMIKKREKTKREQLHLTIEVVEKRYQARDFSGQLQAEYQSQVAKSTTRPAFAPLYSNQYSHLAHQSSPQHQWSASGIGGSGSGGVAGTGSGGLNHHYAGSGGYGAGAGGGVNKRDMDSMNGSSRKEKRQYKKRKHKHTQREKQRMYSSPGPAESMVSSEEEDLCNVQASESEDEGPFGFKRNKSCQYNMPVQNGVGNWPWTSKDENGSADPRYRFTLTSLAHPRPRCIGFARRRIGRGGRVIMDRISTDMDELWSRLDYKIFDSARKPAEVSSSEDSGCVVTALEEPQTQKRLLDISLGSSINLISNSRAAATNGRVLTTNTPAPGGGAVGVSAAPGLSADVVIKSELLAGDGGSLSKLLDRNSSSCSTSHLLLDSVVAAATQQKSQSLDRLSTASSGYFSQQSLPGLVSACASLDAVGLECAVNRMRSGELTRSLSLPLTGPGGLLAKAFQDISASPALRVEASNKKAAQAEAAAASDSVVVIDGGGGDSVDNEDDMSLAELARKSGRVSQSEDELFAMIRKEWLHFTPKPREKKVAEKGKEAADEEVEEDMPKISSIAPLNLEMVTLRTTGEVKREGEDVDVDLPSSIFLNSEDNFFQPQPFALDDLEWRGSVNSSPTSSSAASPLNGSALGAGGKLDQSLSGDSLNELSLNLGDDETGEDNEKVLENILQECQMGDFKILEDPTLFTGLQDTEDEEEEPLPEGDSSQLKNLFDRAIGYESEFVNWALESIKAGNGKKVRRNTVKSVVKMSSSERVRTGGMSRRRLSSSRKVGQTRFKLSRVTRKDETFSADKTSAALDGQTNGGVGSEFEEEMSAVLPHEVSMGEVGAAASGVVTIKQEPDVLLEDGLVQMHEIKVEKQEEGCDQEMVGTTLMMASTSAQGGGMQQAQQQQQKTATRNIIFQGGTNYLAQQGENTIILTSTLNSLKNHLNNGPMNDKTFTTTSTPNKGVQFKRQLTPSQAKQQQQQLTDAGIINNGGGGGGSSGQMVTTNQKFSLTSVGPNQMPKTISIAGQPGASGNKFYLHPASLVNAGQQQQQQITLTTSTTTSGGQSSGGTKSLQYLTPANIKFNFTGASTSGGQGPLPSNIIINDHGGNNIATGSANAMPTLLTTGTAGTVQQQQMQQSVGQGGNQQQQQRKTMNVYVDAEKRFLYTNNRGQFVAQLNPTKMVNIVPVQGGSGATSAGTGGQLQQQQQVLATSSSGNLNSNTKIITTTKGGGGGVSVSGVGGLQQLDGGTTRIVTQVQGQGGNTRQFQSVQRLRPIRNSTQQQLQNAIAKQVAAAAAAGQGGSASGSGGGEVRTLNRIVFQAAPGTGSSVTLGGEGTAQGGGGNGGSASATAGASGESSINVNAINR